MEKYRTRMITNMEKKFCTEKHKEYVIVLKLKSITIQRTKSKDNARGGGSLRSCFCGACILEEIRQNASKEISKQGVFTE